MRTNIERNVAPRGVRQKNLALTDRPTLTDPDEARRLLAEAPRLVAVGLKRGWLKLPEPTPEATPPAGKRTVIDELVARVLLKFKP
jgi:hypothetical protein